MNRDKNKMCTEVIMSIIALCIGAAFSFTIVILM